jgi:hypothetical protein
MVVPYVEGRLHTLVPQLLSTYGFDPQYVKLVGDDGYQRLMKCLWRDKQDVVIVEQDILPWPGAIEELIACECAWGTYTYRTNNAIGVSHMLGCAKLTAGLMQVTDGIWDQWCRWSEIDQTLFFAAQNQLIQPHLHRPAVIHVNPRELKNVEHPL